MSGNRDQFGGGSCSTPDFRTTHWSVVLAAQGEDTPSTRTALEQLCRAYWYPLYAYVRRRGHDSHEAEDLTQEFFSRLLEKNYLAAVRRECGQFRGFLLSAMQRFLTSEWRRGHAAKRGGGQAVLSLDEAAAEGRYRLEPSDAATPETLYNRSWAVTVLDQAQRQLQQEYESSGREKVFTALKPFLSGDRAADSYANIGIRIGLSEDAVKKAVQRLRERYGECVRAQIAHTVSTPAEVDEEIRHLFALFSG